MRKRGLKWLSMLAVLVFLLGNGAFATETLQETDNNFFVTTNPLYEKLADRVKKNARSNSYKGSLLVATEDEIILYGGPGSLTTEGQPADPHTTYDIGSCSKAFTAVAVFQLADAGLVSLDDPITKYFPEYETGRNITLYNLLHMQSGIADYVNDPLSFWALVDEKDLDDYLYRFYHDEVPDEELLQNLYAAPLDFEPGTEMSYSNTNYHLLAMIVEQVSGMKFNEYLQAHIFDPLGMEHTSCMAIGDETSVPLLFTELVALGMVNENGYSMSPNGERGAGGIHTCVTDLWTFDKALLSGQLVSSASLEEIMHFDMEYGCGFEPYGKNAVGHSGRNGTYTTQNMVIDSEQYGRIYFLASTPTDAGSYGLDTLVRLFSGI